MPEITNSAATSGTGVSTLICPQAITEASSTSPLPASAWRKPQRRSTQPVNGFMPMLPANTASTSSPAWKAS